MSTFASDIDLLHWEPAIFRDAAFVSQTLLQGVGDLTGTGFTLADGSLQQASVEPGHVLYLGGAIDGCFPIVEVASETTLTVSVLYDRLFDEPAEPRRVGPDATGVSCAVRTFWPQRRVVSELLLQSLGLTIGQFARVRNPESLKRPCALGALQMIYSALAAAAPEPGPHTRRMFLYEKLYRRSLRSARVEIDLDGDGKADTTRALNLIALVRE